MQTKLNRLAAIFLSAVIAVIVVLSNGCKKPSLFRRTMLTPG